MSELSLFCQKWDACTCVERSVNLPGTGLKCGLVNNCVPVICQSAAWQESFVMSWILTGRGTFRDESGFRKLEPPCLVLRRPTHRYVMELIPETSHRRCYLDVTKEAYALLTRLYPALDTMPSVIPLKFDEHIFAVFDAIIEEGSRDGGSFALLSKAFDLVLRLTGIESDALERAKALLENDTRLLPEIASECGLNYETFRKMFRARYGVSPGRYRIESRIRASTQLLAQGDNIQSAAEKLGYSDEYTFSHQFHAVMGISPSEYQRTHIL